MSLFLPLNSVFMAFTSLGIVTNLIVSLRCIFVANWPKQIYFCLLIMCKYICSLQELELNRTGGLFTCKHNSGQHVMMKASLRLVHLQIKHFCQAGTKTALPACSINLLKILPSCPFRYFNKYLTWKDSLQAHETEF